MKVFAKYPNVFVASLVTCTETESRILSSINSTHAFPGGNKVHTLSYQMSSLDTERPLWSSMRCYVLYMPVCFQETVHKQFQIHIN